MNQKAFFLSLCSYLDLEISKALRKKSLLVLRYSVGSILLKCATWTNTDNRIQSSLRCHLKKSQANRGYRVCQRKWLSISGIQGAGFSVPPGEGNIQPNLMVLSLYSFQCCEASQATLLDLASILSVMCPTPCLVFFLCLHIFFTPIVCIMVYLLLGLLSSL